MDLTTATPVEIDTVLAENYNASNVARMRGMSALDSLAYALPRNERKHASREQILEAARDQAEAQPWNARGIQHSINALHDAEAEVIRLREEAKPLHAEFARRGGWTRAFLVSNVNGHVHRSMDCSTCFPSTQYHWVTEFSGHDEAEIVEAAGERACTVCYPSAPVEVLSRPTSLFTPDEVEKQRARAEREAAKAAREAAQIVIENWQDGSRFVTKTFKTERALTNALASALGDLVWYGEGHPSADEWLWNVEQGRKALPSWDYDKALANARKKVQRDGGSPKF